MVKFSFWDNLRRIFGQGLRSCSFYGPVYVTTTHQEEINLIWFFDPSIVCGHKVNTSSITTRMKVREEYQSLSLFPPQWFVRNVVGFLCLFSNRWGGRATFNSICLNGPRKLSELWIAFIHLFGSYGSCFDSDSWWAGTVIDAGFMNDFRPPHHLPFESWSRRARICFA